MQEPELNGPNTPCGVLPTAGRVDATSTTVAMWFRIDRQQNIRNNEIGSELANTEEWKVNYQKSVCRFNSNVQQN
ncbi:MAG: hypothetical protein DHS20C16_30680 [Phycisphaerae bacterium]|nr:MAG: hypothetical protein DHS20C16_30680 [Phycisphaerae bacterium]